jgi:hypothetical protein
VFLTLTQLAALSWDVDRCTLRYELGEAGIFSVAAARPANLRVMALRGGLMVTSRCLDEKGSTPKESLEARFEIWTRA